VSTTGLPHAVDDDEVVALPVHLGEAQPHGVIFPDKASARRAARLEALVGPEILLGASRTRSSMKAFMRRTSASSRLTGNPPRAEDVHFVAIADLASHGRNDGRATQLRQAGKGRDRGGRTPKKGEKTASRRRSPCREEVERAAVAQRLDDGAHPVLPREHEGEPMRNLPRIRKRSSTGFFGRL